jgi:hypothetical protein
LVINNLSHQDYVIKAGVYIGAEEEQKLSYLYGYYSPENSRKYILAGAFVDKPKQRGIYEFLMANVTPHQGTIRIYLGPVVYQGKGRGEGGSNYGWLSLQPKDIFGAWDYLKILPLSEIPKVEEVRGGKYRLEEKEIERITELTSFDFSVEVPGNFQPVMKYVEIECLEGRVTFPKILVAGGVDFSTLRAITDSITQGATSDEEKALSIFNFIVGPFFYHTTRATEKGRSFYNALKTINVYGYGWCMVHSSIFYALCRTAGLKVQSSQCGHKWNRVRWDGKWHFFDCDLGMVIRDENNEILSIEEILGPKRKFALMAGDEFGLSPIGLSARKLNYPLDKIRHTNLSIGRHSMSFTLRAGEKLIRWWGGEELNVNLWYNPRQNHCPIDGRGQIIWKWQANSTFKQELKEVENLDYNKLKNSLEVKDTHQPASLIISVKTPYVIRGGEIILRGTWRKLVIFLREMIFTRPQAWYQIEDNFTPEKKLRLPIPRDSYHYELKLLWPPQEQKVSLSGFDLKTEIQYYFMTLPQLNLGQNKITYLSEEQQGKVRIKIAYTARHKLPIKEEANEYGWSEEIGISKNQRDCMLPAIASTKDKLCIVYQQGRLWDKSSLWYVVKEGKSDFSAPQKITPDNLFGWHPEVASDRAGNFHFVWQGSENVNSSDIYYCCLKPNGNITGLERINKDDTRHTAFNPYISASINGEITIGWEGSGESLVYKKQGETNWQRQAIDKIGLSTFIYDPTSTLHQLAYQWQRVWYQKFKLGDSLPSSLYFLPAWVRATSRPWLTLDEQGTIYVVFSGYRNGTESEIFIRVKKPNLFWSKVIQLSDEDMADSIYPVVSASKGKIGVVWMDNRDGNFEVWWKEFNGLTWTPDIRLSKLDGIASKHPRIIYTNENEVYVCWYDEGEGIKVRKKES